MTQYYSTDSTIRNNWCGLIICSIKEVKLRKFPAGCMYLNESSAERFEDALWQCGLCTVSEGTSQKQRSLLLNRRVLIVHHSQNVL